MIGNLLTPLVAKISLGIIATLALALAWLQFVTVPRLETRLKASREAHTATKANFERAMIEAESKALMAAYEAQQRYDKQRKQSDERLVEASADAMRRADNYISANRVRCPRQAAASAPRRTDLPRTAEPAESDNRSGGDADLVAVSDADVRICTVNSVRLKEAQDWVAGL